MSTEFGYWYYRGKGDFLRWVMVYLQVPYSPFTPRDDKQWNKRRSELTSRNSLISLPYLVDGNLCISEATAIAHYLCLKFNGKFLLGKTGTDIINHRACQELIAAIRQFCFECVEMTEDDLKKNFEAEVKRRIAPKIKYMDAFKMASSDFLLGYVTLADFELAHVTEFLDWICNETGMINPISKYLNLYLVKDAVRGLPKVKEYVESLTEEQKIWIDPALVKFGDHPMKRDGEF